MALDLKALVETKVLVVINLANISLNLGSSKTQIYLSFYQRFLNFT